MKHGEVWLVDFSPKVGQEIDKIRPAIIINHDSMGALELKVVVPITDATRWVREWHVSLYATLANGLSKESIADCFQVKSISKKRFVKQMGKLSKQEMDEVKIGLIKVLDLL